MKIIKSVSNSQEEIIENIIELHSSNKQIDVDLTYSKGQFYKNKVVKEPTYKFDLSPQTEDTIQSSSETCPLESNSVKTIMFDPPFIIAGKTYNSNVDGSSKIAKRFGAYENYEQLNLSIF